MKCWPRHCTESTASFKKAMQTGKYLKCKWYERRVPVAITLLLPGWLKYQYTQTSE